MKIGKVKIKKEFIWKIIMIVSSILLILSSLSPMLFIR